MGTCSRKQVFQEASLYYSVAEEYLNANLICVIEDLGESRDVHIELCNCLLSVWVLYLVCYLRSISLTKCDCSRGAGELFGDLCYWGVLVNSCIFDRIHVFCVDTTDVRDDIHAELTHCSFQLPWVQYRVPAGLQESATFICMSLFSNLAEKKVILHEDHSLSEHTRTAYYCYKGALA